MEKRRLGRTGLDVSVISFGALPIQRLSEEDAGRVLNAALDAGINFIDTARAYTDSEAKIGRSLAGRRQEYYLATKSMARDKAGMARDIAKSLETMQTDYIDLYQIHNPTDADVLAAVLAPDGALAALKEAQAAGKVRHIGITGHNLEVLAAALKTNEFSTVQVPFNFVEQKALDELFPLAQEMDVGRIVMKPLGGGQLANIDLALRFVLESDITCAIPGMDDVAQIEQNIRSAREFAPLTADERAVLQREADTIGPDFCRRCGYCMPCSVGIDIPTNFIFHLQYTRYKMHKPISERYAKLKVKASACSECGICESRCPYNLPIRAKLKQVAKDLG